jgi:ADP-ribose pyrophosphatase YjhB (NUDIX family)
MKTRSPRLAARAIILQDARLLLVNAYPAAMGSDLWCAPGGGVEMGQSIPDNLIREVHEETGLSVSVGELALASEFHDPDRDFHQLDLFFRCKILTGQLDPNWQDKAAVVTERRFFSRLELDEIRLKPDKLPDVAFGAGGSVHMPPLERIVD